jgi:hypothetical protein
MPAPAPKTLEAYTNSPKTPHVIRFVVDDRQTNILISDVNFTFTVDTFGTIFWNIEFYQRNVTHALGSPNNGYLYVDLMDANSFQIPGQQIVIGLQHKGCTDGWIKVVHQDNKSSGYPLGSTLMDLITSLRLRCERITYDTDDC